MAGGSRARKGPAAKAPAPNAEPISKMRRTANLLRRLGIVTGHLESTNRAHTRGRAAPK